MKKSSTKTICEILPTRSHLRELVYDNLPKKSHLGKHIYRKTLTKTYLRGIIYENSPTKLAYDNLPTRTHLQGHSFACIVVSKRSFCAYYYRFRAFFCVHCGIRVFFLRTLTISSILSPCVDDSEHFLTLH